MKILVVGDLYMPSRFFRKGFADLPREHEIEYFEIGREEAFAPSTPSELRLLEYFGSPPQIAKRMVGVEVLAVHGAPVTDAALDASQELQLVCCARGGPVNVDLDAVTARGHTQVRTPKRSPISRSGFW